MMSIFQNFSRLRFLVGQHSSSFRPSYNEDCVFEFNQVLKLKQEANRFYLYFSTLQLQSIELSNKEVSFSYNFL